eukprot:CAMPEP_0184337840 /NCGR_PEP_ID=MMETSP1089-20130417/6278_1 /TAXON_ID=38269 ORGANISM="Gloeochaete wittrockiana, Strain SAG46.84" /NCGR_SAMPLE_ID=MMETSP1089 /ASSEMBLY_ACC=CAM_ASM_000445 /LENGTH=663 /DNA_ID=CAMNT_0026663921 /DNA_START=99 /DNA_END=2090 /DNA_ORIENTATION=+
MPIFNLKNILRPQGTRPTSAPSVKPAPSPLKTNAIPPASVAQSKPFIAPKNTSKANHLPPIATANGPPLRSVASPHTNSNNNVHTHPSNETVLAIRQLLTPKVPIYVMLPLDTVLMSEDGSHQVLHIKAEELRLLKEAGAEGVMTDVWWGMCERRPRSYDFSGYLRLIEMVAQTGLKLQVVTSFHKCGGNVGDAVTLPLPEWVLEIGRSNSHIFYNDQDGNHNDEYLSLGVDTEALFPPFSSIAFDIKRNSSDSTLSSSSFRSSISSASSPAVSEVSSSLGSDDSTNGSSPPSSPMPGRTGLQLYDDFLQAFAETFRPYFGQVLTQVQVSLGPAGELRYPSYPLALGWEFPGIGQVQCYDRYMLQSLQSAADDISRPEWGVPPPGLGSYNDKPWDTKFFDDATGHWRTDHGHFFLKWYSTCLLQHGDRILSIAYRIFSGAHTSNLSTMSAKRASALSSHVSLAAKVAGVHWWYRTDAHAPELTAGYYNTLDHDGYKPIARMFAKYDVHFDFTCLEMRNCETNHEWQCAPEDLVIQTSRAAAEAGCAFAGENALPRFDDYAYRQMVYESYRTQCISLTYLRMSPDLFVPENLARFARFCRVMHSLSKDHVQLMLLEWFTDLDEPATQSSKSSSQSLSPKSKLQLKSSGVSRPLCECEICLRSPV